MLGGEWKEKRMEVTFHGYSQWKQSPRIANESTVTNLNNALVMAAIGTGKVHLTRYFETMTGVTYSYSKIEGANSPFPFIPSLILLNGLSFHDSREDRRWEAALTGRLTSSQIRSLQTQERVAPYAIWDASGQVKLSREASLSARVENLADRKVELIRGYPLGRAFSLSLIGAI